MGSGLGHVVDPLEMRLTLQLRAISVRGSPPLRRACGVVVSAQASASERKPAPLPREECPLDHRQVRAFKHGGSGSNSGSGGGNSGGGRGSNGSSDGGRMFWKLCPIPAAAKRWGEKPVDASIKAY